MKHINFSGQRALVRVDFNVPIKEGAITDDTRIRAAIPTIRHIVEHGGSVILLSHLGRPQKKKLPNGEIDVASFTLAPIAPHLASLMDTQVQFIPVTRGISAYEQISQLPSGSIVLLENTRFEPGETKGDEALAKDWAKMADVFVNDAFGTAHRAHASNAIVAKFFDQSHKGFGLLLEKEIEAAKQVLYSPERPFTAILGGAKVSDKILLIENLLDKADSIIIGGGMAYTFFKASGGDIGSSLCENDKLMLAEELINKAKSKGVDLLLPQDSIIADQFAADANSRLANSDEIAPGWMGLDIGPAAIATFSKTIQDSKTICWNGPMGVFEMESFAQGTKSIAEEVAKATESGAYSLIGGGDSVAAINQLNLQNKVSYVSTGGGAMLTMLEGGSMPGITAIKS